MSQKPPLQNRVYLLDEIRGFAILCMVLYHTTFDLLNIFQIDFPFFFSDFMNGTRDLFAGIFILISGAACRFSRNNLKRGFLCFGLGMVMTIATLIVMPEDMIVFGILHMLGFSMVLFSLIQPLMDKPKRLVMIGVLLFLFIFTYTVSDGYLSIFGLLRVPLPSGWYLTNWFSPLGFYNTSFASADYFPILPWTFLFLLGAMIGCYIKERRFPPFFYRSHSRFLGTVGRYTIYIYMLHQPIIFGVFYLIKLFM